MNTSRSNLSVFLFAGTCLAGAALTVVSLPAAQAAPAAPVAAMAKISSAEAQDLAFMREEEKLAQDVYAALYRKWQTRVFDNIRQSEATHTAQVKSLLDAFGLSDPLAGLPEGKFANPELQKLFDELVEQGSQSQAAALKVGVAIEELDIRDLDTRLARTSNPDIRRIYLNLKRGSENHLRAFSGTR